MRIRHITIPKPKDKYVKVRSLSEQIAKRYLERKGYKAIRGFHLEGFMNISGNQFVWKKFCKQVGVKKLIRISKYCRVNHGTPDYITVTPHGKILAVEVKLGHEKIMSHQLKTMRQLMTWGVPCEVWRVMHPQRIREKQLNFDIWNGENLRKAVRKTKYDDRVTSSKWRKG